MTCRSFVPSIRCMGRWRPTVHPHAAPSMAAMGADAGGRLPQILASIGQLEFFYDQAPDVMRSCSMALQLLSVAIGSYLSGALVYAVGRYSVGLGGANSGWLPNDLNYGRVDLFFLLLAGAPAWLRLTSYTFITII